MRAVNKLNWIEIEFKGSVCPLRALVLVELHNAFEWELPQC